MNSPRRHLVRNHMHAVVLRAQDQKDIMFPRTEENLTAQQGTKLVRRDVKARCFRMSSITCYAVGESGEGMEGMGERESTCYWAIPINYQTSYRKRGQFITFDEAKS